MVYGVMLRLEVIVYMIKSMILAKIARKRMTLS